MEFTHGSTVYRDRRPQVVDPYNPSRTEPGSWEDAQTATIANAFVASASSSSIADPTREQLVIRKSLYCQPDADVRVGDRIRVGSDSYVVREAPEADVNPFTGWQPVREVPLEQVIG